MRIIFIAVMAFLAASCSSETKPNEEEIRTYDTSTLFYDIPLAIRNEVAGTKRTFPLIYTVTTLQEKKDTVEIDTTRFEQLAAPFMQYNLNESRFRKYYKEEMFEDTDTKSIVFSYSTNHPDLPVKLATVSLDNESQQLKSIYIQQMNANKDTLFDDRLTWDAVKKTFMLVKTSFIGERELSKQQTRVFWKDR